jgi:hypothetical protein
MIDPDLQKKLDEINQNLIVIKANTKSHLWKSFFSGTLSALGSVIGAAIALAIIGYILNAVGVIPAFREQVGAWKQTIDKLEQTR